MFIFFSAAFDFGKKIKNKNNITFFFQDFHGLPLSVSEMELTHEKIG